MLLFTNLQIFYSTKKNWLNSNFRNPISLQPDGVYLNKFEISKIYTASRCTNIGFNTLEFVASNQLFP